MWCRVVRGSSSVSNSSSSEHVHCRAMPNTRGCRRSMKYRCSSRWPFTCAAGCNPAQCPRACIVPDAAPSVAALQPSHTHVPAWRGVVYPVSSSLRALLLSSGANTQRVGASINNLAYQYTRSARYDELTGNSTVAYSPRANSCTRRGPSAGRNASLLQLTAAVLHVLLASCCHAIL